MPVLTVLLEHQSSCPLFRVRTGYLRLHPHAAEQGYTTNIETKDVVAELGTFASMSHGHHQGSRGPYDIWQSF